MKLITQFSTRYLKFYTSQFQPQESFNQLAYLNIVLQTQKEKQYALQQQKYFYSIPQLYERISKQEIDHELKLINEQQIKQYMEQCGQQLLQSNSISTKQFIELILIIPNFSNLDKYLPLIDYKLTICKDNINSDNISVVTFIRFCKSMNYLLKNSRNIGSKLNYQNLAFQILIQKANDLNMSHIYALLHYLQLVNISTFSGYLEYKQLAFNVTKIIYSIIISKIPTQAKEFQNPELYSKFLQFMIHNHVQIKSYYQEIEKLFITNAIQFSSNQTKLGYYRLIFCKLQKLGAGNLILDQIIKQQNITQEHTNPSYLSYYLLSLLQYRVSLIMQQLILNPTNSNFKLLLSKQHQLDSILLQVQQDICNQNKQSFHDPQNIQQLITSFELLKSLNLISDQFKIFISELSDNLDKKQPISRYNEINAEVERFLKLNNIEYKMEHQIGPFYCDFYLPNEKLIIECDGSFHYITEIINDNKLKNIDQVSSTHSRNFYFISNGYRIILVNWWKQHSARNTNKQQSYLEELWTNLKESELLIYT